MKQKATLLVLMSAFLLVSFVFGKTPTPALKINEFLASNDYANLDPFGGNDDWLEIYNAGAEAVDIGGMYITDDLSEPTKWQIPDTQSDSTTILPGCFLILWADGEPEQGVLHIDPKLSGGGEQIGLIASDGVTVIDSLTYGEQTADISQGRLSDGTDAWEFFTNPTPGYTNRMIPIVINEFLASNDFCCTDPFGGNDDWIEIMNVGIFPVDIGGMHVTDDLTSPTEWQIPVDSPDTTTIQPGGFAILWADKESEQGVMHVDIKLSGDGEQIGIFADDGETVIDSLSFGPQEADTSYGRAHDGMNTWTYFSTPTPGASNINEQTSSVDKQELNSVAKSFELYQNYPNPFNPETTIRFELANAQRIEISVYNVLGQKIATLFDGYKNAGKGQVKWNALGQSSGLYFYKISSDDFTMTRKMLLSK